MASASKTIDARWTPELLDELTRWVARAYPEEGCGLILAGEGDAWRFHGCENVADKYHRLDPEHYPRTARDFYMIDPMEFVRADERGDTLAVIVHSHPDVGDYFSAEDIAAATFPRESDDEPLEPIYPDTDYLVVSVRKGKADAATLFRFDQERGEFASVKRFTALELSGSAQPVG